MNVFQSLSHNRIKISRIVVILLFVFTSTALLTAADYTIDSFNTTIEVTKHGYYDISEDVTLTFNVPKHGFYRTLPTFFPIEAEDRYIDARVTKISASDDRSVNYSNQGVVIRLGNADRTVTGTHDYSISYRYDIGEDRFDDRDEFYYNIIGVDWQEPIKETSFVVKFPQPVDKNNINFTRGLYGSIGSEGVDWSLDASNTIITGSVNRLEKGEAVTIKVNLPEGYYAKRPNYQAMFAPFALLLNLFVVFVAITWWKTYGKDKDLIVVPQYYPPKGLSPMDVGYIIDSHLDSHDVTSMLFYWADKGALTIVEDGKKLSFVKGSPITASLKHEQMLYDKFFALGKNGVVTEEDMSNGFSKVYMQVTEKISSYYSKDKRLDNKTSATKARLIALFAFVPILTLPLVLTLNYIGIATLIIGGVALGYMVLNTLLFYNMFRKWHIRKSVSKVMFFLILFILFLIFAVVLLVIAFMETTQHTISYIAIPIALLAILILSLFSIITTQRSVYGVEMLELILGLRDFIEKVELDELKRMIEKEPQFYYRILSFAIVLGLEKKWAKKFSSFTLEPPNWYSGNALLFNSLALSSMVHRCDSSVVSNLAPKGSQSGPGGHSFGGSGGFSGGGFGGGGGGAW